MEKKTFIIDYVTKHGEIVSSSIMLWKQNEIINGRNINCTYLKFHYVNNSIEAKGFIVKEAFDSLREKLEDIGIKLMIKGYRYDVCMYRKLSNTIYCVQLLFGEPFNPENKNRIFNIFEKEENSAYIKSLAHQKEYYNKWIKSVYGISCDEDKII
ncbi:MULTISPECIES: hypothetical protein [unclassified Myroides]|uniref:hypothetical protein n=1 Tax=unclassified Myroides TaxID=2642485 RepID=UPI003D2F578F